MTRSRGTSCTNMSFGVQSSKSTGFLGTVNVGSCHTSSLVLARRYNTTNYHFLLSPSVLLWLARVRLPLTPQDPPPLLGIAQVEISGHFWGRIWNRDLFHFGPELVGYTVAQLRRRAAQGHRQKCPRPLDKPERATHLLVHTKRRPP